jgi:hypothetical protein
LKAASQELFSISHSKEASVVDHLQFSNDMLLWNITFIISVHDWEVDLITSFFNLLYSLRLRQGGEDNICWIPSWGGAGLRSNLFSMR